MSTLKIKPKKAKKTKTPVLRGTDNFPQDMLLAGCRNHEALDGLSTAKQGVGMAKIFADNDIVFGAFPDMSKPRGVDFAIIKGSTEAVLAKPDVATRGVMMTAFIVDDREEAETFAQIYAWRQREVAAQGKASDEIRRFWERMTPKGRIESARGATVREWAELMDDMKGAASLIDQVMRKMRSAAE